MIVCSIWRVKIALFFRFCLESSFLSFFSEWVKVGLFFSKGVSSDSSIFPSLWFLTGKEWYRGRVCWVGFKLSLLYFPLPMVPYGAGVTEGPHLLGGFWVKFALSQFRFLYLPLSQFIEVGFQLSLLYLSSDSSFFLYKSLDSFYAFSNTVQDKLKGEREEGTV